MKTLSYEMIVNVAKFLEMRDLVSFSSCGKTYMELCRDDFLYRILYGRDFAKYCLQFSPVLENISSWKKLYSILWINKRYMVQVMEKHFGLRKEPIKHNKNILTATLNENDDDPEMITTYVFFGYIEIPLVLGNKKKLKFTPDVGQILGLRHLNLAHQVYKLDQELGRRTENPYLKGPPQGEHMRFLEEGVSFWNEKKEMYCLVYPFPAIRAIFDECKAQVTFQYENKLEDQRLLLSQVLSFTYSLEKEEGIEVDEISLKNFFKNYDLEVTEHVLVTNTLYVTCNRKPNWSYTDDMCIFHSNTYDAKIGKAIEFICKEKATPGKEYCPSHKTPTHHVYLRKSHRRHRSKLRNEEYINYLPKILPTSFSIDGIHFSQTSLVEEI